MTFWRLGNLFERSTLPDAPQGLIAKAPSILRDLAHRDFKCTTSVMNEVLLALRDQCPEASNICPLDTKFHTLNPSGRVKIVEVSFADIKTGQVVVNTIFDDEQAFNASLKLSTLYFQSKTQQTTSKTRIICQVHTICGLVEQMKHCHFQQNDIFIKYSKNGNINLKNVRQLLEQTNYDCPRHHSS